MCFALVRAPSQSYLQVSFIPNMSPSPGFRLGRGRRDGRQVLPRRVGARLVRRRRRPGRGSDDEDAATACGRDCKDKNDDYWFNQRSNLLYCERISILINDKYSIHQRNQRLEQSRATIRDGVFWLLALYSVPLSQLLLGLASRHQHNLHTYLARRSTVIIKAVPPGRGSPLHSGWADPYECPKCGHLDSAISVSGRVAFALLPENTIIHMCLRLMIW